MEIFNSDTMEIVIVTLQLAFLSTLFSTLLGVPLGFWLSKTHVPFKKTIVRINRTLMGVPPVVMGLVVYMLLMNKGPLGELDLLFTLPAMVIAQVGIITPIICGQIYAMAIEDLPHIQSFATTMGVNRYQMFFLLLKEMRYAIYFSIVTGFGRSISEVGAIMIVGGNIEHKTRTMTTAISLLRTKGDFSEAITLGIILIVLAFFIQLMADIFMGKEDLNENF